MWFRSVAQHVDQKCHSEVRIKGDARKCRPEASVRSVLKKVDQKKCRSEVLLEVLIRRSVVQKCWPGVAQKCPSEVWVRSVAHSEVLLRSVAQKRQFSIVQSVVQKCR